MARCGVATAPGEATLDIEEEDVLDAQFTDADRPDVVRSPVSLVHLAAAMAFLALALALASLTGGDTSDFAGNVTPLILSVPRWLLDSLLGTLQVTVALCAVTGIIALLVTTRFRRLGAMMTAAISAGLLLVLVSHLMGDGVITIKRLQDSPLGIGTTFPSLIMVAAITAAITTDAVWWARRWRRYGWMLIATAVLARVVVASTDPGAVAVTIGVGWTCGRVLLLAWGTPNPRPRRSEVAEALRRFGYAVTLIAEVPRGGQLFHAFVTADRDGRTFFVKVFGRESWTTLLPVRVYRSLRFRDVDDPPFASVRHRVEHEALCALKAHSDGVPSARLAVVSQFGIDSMMLAFESGHFDVLSDLPEERWTPELLNAVWTSVAELRASRIAHHRLSAERMIVDVTGTVRIVDFADAEIGASDRALAADVAEVLAATGARVGAAEAVAAAQSVLGDVPLGMALPRLQPLALTPQTRGVVRHTHTLADLSTEVQSITGVPAAPLEDVQRIKLSTLLVIATTALAGWLLIPQLLRMGDLWGEVRRANWWWAGGALGFSAVSYLGAAAAFDGSVPDRVPFLPNVAVQFASGLVSTITTGASLALGARFLQKRGVDSAVAVGAMGVNTIAGVVVHVALTAVFIAFDGTRVFHQFKLSSLPTTAIVAVVIAVPVVVAIGVTIPAVRKLTRERIIPPLRRSGQGIVEIAHRPAKLIELFGGSAVITLTNVFALVAAVEAFGGGPAVVETALVYLVGSAISNAAPTPGAIGATEAALTAGLVAAGMTSHVALAAVLLFRVATFWLPLIPGWITLAGLQRAGDI